MALPWGVVGGWKLSTVFGGVLKRGLRAPLCPSCHSAPGTAVLSRAPPLRSGHW